MSGYILYRSAHIASEAVKLGRLVKGRSTVSTNTYPKVAKTHLMSVVDISWATSVYPPKI